MKQTTETELKPACMATLDELIRTTLPPLLAPVPCRDTLRQWFDDARIPRFKANPVARRGGGAVYYNVPAVEALFRCDTSSGPSTATAAGVPVTD